MTEIEARQDITIGDIGKPGWFPRVDMLFDSENDAYEVCNTYAENIGFFVRRSTLWTHLQEHCYQKDICLFQRRLPREKERSKGGEVLAA